MSVFYITDKRKKYQKFQVNMTHYVWCSPIQHVCMLNNLLKFFPAHSTTFLNRGRNWLKAPSICSGGLQRLGKSSADSVPGKIRDVDHLRQILQLFWSTYSQSEIDGHVNQFRPRLRKVVECAGKNLSNFFNMNTCCIGEHQT